MLTRSRFSGHFPSGSNPWPSCRSCLCYKERAKRKPSLPTTFSLSAHTAPYTFLIGSTATSPGTRFLPFPSLLALSKLFFTPTSSGFTTRSKHAALWFQLRYLRKDRVIQGKKFNLPV